MGCFLSCIRIKKHDRRKNHRIDSKNKDIFKRRNGILSMFINYESRPLSEQQVSVTQASPSENSLDRELQHEAKFLKSCGALLDCPVEFCKASYEKLSQAPDESRLPNQNLQLLHASNENDTSNSPRQIDNDHTSYMEHQSISCESVQNEKLRKIVHFEEALRIAGVAPEAPSRMESPKQELRLCSSPHPTPLNLSDEMNTPGTVYTATTDNLRTGKKVKVRAHYVFPVPNPVENVPRDEQNGEDCPLFNKSSGLVQNIEIFGTDGRENMPMSIHTDINSSEEENVKSIYQEKVTYYASFGRQLPVARSSFEEETPLSKDPNGERPLLGTLPSYWYKDHISPKGWDGNGIPNTTAKYREDQKVNWHATPFVVRLEKALSDEKHFPQRKLPHEGPEFDEENKKLI